MSDAVEMFEQAKKNGYVSEEALRTELHQLTLQDWRKISQVYPQDESHPEKMSVEERPGEFLVHNDQSSLGKEAVLTTVGNLIDDALIMAGGYRLGMLLGDGLGGVIGMVAGGCIALCLQHRILGHMEQIQKTANPLHVPKQTIPGGNLAVLGERQSQLGKFLLEGNFDNLRALHS